MTLTSLTGVIVEKPKMVWGREVKHFTGLKDT